MNYEDYEDMPEEDFQLFQEIIEDVVDENFPDGDIPESAGSILDTMIENYLKEKELVYLDIKRYGEFVGLLDYLKHVFSGQDVTFKTKLHIPFPTDGCIDIEGPDLFISDPTDFDKHAKIAENYEVYPLTSGKLRMSFRFTDVYKPIRGKREY